MSTVFKGDDKALIRSITALLDLDAKGSLAPHGIGNMARDLLEASAARLAEQHQGEPVEDCETFEYQLDMLGSIDRCNVSCGGYGDKYHRWDDSGPYVEYEDHVKHIELYKREVERLSKLYTRPAQGEPVAYILTPPGCAAALVHAVDLTYRSEHAVPLYTHADPSDIRVTRQALNSLKGEAKDLRAELAQLRAALKFYADRDHYSTDDGLNWDSCSGEPANILWHESEPWFIEDGSIARAALPDRAEPAAPKCSYCGDTGQIMVGRSGDANDGNAPIMEPCEDCDRDNLTDLTTWKRRAIEAESKLRIYDPRVVDLGAKAFSALLADPTKDLVLTKCKLCDQLQADLTARDQRIDQFEQVMQKVATLRGTLEQHGLREEVEALLWPDLHSRPEERGTPATEPCSGCGTLGWTGACSRCTPY